MYIKIPRFGKPHAALPSLYVSLHSFFSSHSSFASSFYSFLFFICLSFVGGLFSLEAYHAWKHKVLAAVLIMQSDSGFPFMISYLLSSPDFGRCYNTGMEKGL